MKSRVKLTTFVMGAGDFLMLLAMLLSTWSCTPTPPPSPPPPAGTGGEIHGFVATSTKRDLAGASVSLPGIRLPQIQVQAKNVSTNALSAPVQTNVFGHFITPKLPAGRYQLCVR